MHMEGDVGRLQQQIQARLIVREDRMALSEAEGINLRKLANKKTGIVRRDSTLVDLLKTILKFAVTFEKDYNKIFVATRIVDIVKGMIDSAFPTGTSVQSYYIYMRVAKITLRHVRVLPWVKTLNTDDPGSNSIGISYSDDIRLCRRPWESSQFSLERQITL